jgi:hypothetical protein
MSETGIAKIFMHGRSQAVGLPFAWRPRLHCVESSTLFQGIVTAIDAFM